MCTVRRLESLREIVGQQMAARLMQHNLLQHLGKEWQLMYELQFVLPLYCDACTIYHTFNFWDETIKSP